MNFPSDSFRWVRFAKICGAHFPVRPRGRRDPDFETLECLALGHRFRARHAHIFGSLPRVPRVSGEGARHTVPSPHAGEGTLWHLLCPTTARSPDGAQRHPRPVVPVTRNVPAFRFAPCGLQTGSRPAFTYSIVKQLRALPRVNELHSGKQISAPVLLLGAGIRPTSCLYPPLEPRGGGAPTRRSARITPGGLSGLLRTMRCTFGAPRALRRANAASWPLCL